ncbi:MAG TPA: hypothetical protein VL371_19405 [Gemmataceae bacterium]|jgi:hypothetical protein|nr:hypothetical protein [Gemmataceae bacterium]
MNRRHTHWLLWAFIPTVLVALLWLWMRSPVPEPDSNTAQALERTAERLWRPGDPARIIPATDWPEELRRLGPRSVRVSSEGVFIEFGSFFVEESGLFVLPLESDFRPQPGTDPSYRLLRGRVYRYDIKG